MGRHAPPDASNGLCASLGAWVDETSSEIGSYFNTIVLGAILTFAALNVVAYLWPHRLRRLIIYLLVPVGWILRTWILPVVLPICALISGQWEETKTFRSAGLYGSQLPRPASEGSS